MITSQFRPLGLATKVMVVIGCVLVFAITTLIKGTQARKRGGSAAAPPVDNSP